MNDVRCQITSIFLILLCRNNSFMCVFPIRSIFFTLLRGFQMNIDTKVKITSKGLQFSISSMQLPPSFRVLLFCVVCLAK